MQFLLNKQFFLLYLIKYKYIVLHNTSGSTAKPPLGEVVNEVNRRGLPFQKFFFRNNSLAASGPLPLNRGRRELFTQKNFF